MNWPVVKLGDAVRFVGGGTPSKKNSEFWGGDIPWASVKDFQGSRLDQTVDYITSAGLENSASRLLPTGTVVIPTRMALGKAAITTRPIAINQDLKGVLPLMDIAPAYLLHYFQSQSEAIDRLGEGATVKGIRIEKLSRLEIPLPPLDEQKRIAAVLDKADALRRQRQESLQLSEKLLQSVFADMFGDPETMPQVEFAKLLTKPLRNGLSPASGGLHNDTVFTLSAITRGYFNSQARKDAMFASPPRLAARVAATDFLICRGNGNPQLCGRGQFPTEDAIGVVFPDTIIAASIDLTQVAKDYFRTIWNQPFVRRQIESGARTASGIHKVNQTTLEGVMIPVPNFHAQMAFGQVAASFVSAARDLEASAEHVENLFLGLQQRAFKGELDLSRVTLKEEIREALLDFDRTFNRTLPEPVDLTKRSIAAPPKIERSLKAQDAILAKGEPIDWSEDYFRFRILGGILQAPFCFTKIWEVIEQRMPEADYGVVKDKIFEFIANGTLRQRFDKKQRALVFFPRRR